ncbi:MAG: ABC-type multidrug transport system ATPase subunit, partial [Myxococcota bacterium]
ELGVDGVLVSALIHKHDPRTRAAGDEEEERRVPLRGDRIVIGRSPRPACDVVLADPQVAPRHAVLIRSGSGWRIEDLGSGRPVVVDARPVRQAPLRPESQIRIGPYRLRLGDDELIIRARPSFSALTVRNLHRQIGSVTLLDDVSFTLFSGEVVALVGPSGAGKTTLLNAISGVAPADSGEVLLDQQGFHALLEADRSLVGSVPQDDLVSPELTVEESLHYSGRLRLPGGTKRAKIAERVTEVLIDLGIHNVRDSRIGDALQRGISGGQRKRVNLGQELMSRSTRVLFLDEPTSGLDPQASQDIIRLVRLLADEGRMVFLVTHDLTPEILTQVDHLMVLARGGRVAFFGPPREAARWFNVSTPDAIFQRLADHTEAEWAQMYRESDAYRKYVATRERLFTVQRAAAPSKRRRAVAAERPGLLRQFATLSHRYLRTKLRDRTGLLVMGFQPPFLVAVMAILFPSPTVEMLFMFSLSALWFGLSASVRELISDRVIWRRERRVGTGVLPYIASKVVVLAGFTGLQALVLAAANYLVLGMGGEYGFSFPLLLLTSVLTAWLGMAMGLLVSASWTSSEAAVGTLPLLLIPQIAFSSIMLPLDDMGAAATACTWITFQRYTFDAAIKCGEMVSHRGRVDYETQPINGALYDLGLKTAAADDMGIELSHLLAILAVTAVVLIALTTLRVWLRER